MDEAKDSFDNYVEEIKTCVNQKRKKIFDQKIELKTDATQNETPKDSFLPVPCKSIHCSQLKFADELQTEKKKRQIQEYFG